MTPKKTQIRSAEVRSYEVSLIHAPYTLGRGIPVFEPEYKARTKPVASVPALSVGRSLAYAALAVVATGVWVIVVAVLALAILYVLPLVLDGLETVLELVR